MLFCLLVDAAYRNRRQAHSWVFAVQAVIGGLVAKTLTTSSTNPYAQGGAGARAAPVALDVFSVQVQSATYLLFELYTGLARKDASNMSEKGQAFTL